MWHTQTTARDEIALFDIVERRKHIVKVETRIWSYMTQDRSHDLIAITAAERASQKNFGVTSLAALRTLGQARGYANGLVLTYFMKDLEPLTSAVDRTHSFNIHFKFIQEQQARHFGIDTILIAGREIKFEPVMKDDTSWSVWTSTGIAPPQPKYGSFTTLSTTV